LHHDALRMRVNTGDAKEPERDQCRRRACHVLILTFKMTSLSIPNFQHPTPNMRFGNWELVFGH